MSESDEDHQPSEQDQEVAGSEDAAIEVEEQEHHPQINEHLSVLREQNDNRCATYVFSNQDHTLGNVLRTVLSGHRDVQFVGYSIPHPSETKMNLRLQTLKMDSNLVLNEALGVVQEISKTLRYGEQMMFVCDILNQLMSYPSHELSKLNVAKKYFETLKSDSESYFFYQGAPYVTSLMVRCGLFFNIAKKLNELNNFYPYVPVISLTRDQYIDNKKQASYKAAAISAVGCGILYSLGIKGNVLPILREYGRLIKTHRLLRQYLYMLIVPYVYLSYSVDYDFLNHTEHLWATHARRLNAKIIKDPKDTRYPFDMLPISQIDVWQSYYCHTSDRERKQANEVNLYDAPDYEEKQLKIYDSAAKPEEEEQE